MKHPRIPDHASEPPDCRNDAPRNDPADFGLIEAFLRRATIEDCELVPWGSNYTFAVLLNDPAGEHEESLGIYKPVAGEVPLWDFPSDTLYHREYSAYLVPGHWAGTSSRRRSYERPHGTGSVQQYIEPEEEAHYFSFRDEHRDDLERIALFDIITNNADRKAGHTLRGLQDGRIWGIDHGLTFNVEPKLRTVIWDFQLEPIRPELRSDIQRVAADEDLARTLSEHLTRNEVRAFQIRARHLAREGVYPPLMSRRSIPWGW
ncbi:MAG: SCO1664 family protein [Thermomicrobiales bacterium]